MANNSTAGTKKPPLVPDLEDLHKMYCDQGKFSYEDPATGYTGEGDFVGDGKDTKNVRNQAYIERITHSYV